MASLPEYVVSPGLIRIEQHRQSASDGAIHEVGAPGDDVVAPKHEARDEEIGELYTRINFLEKKVKRLEREKQDEASKHEREIGELLSRILEMGRELEEKKSELEEAVNRCQTQCENIKLEETDKFIWKKRAIDRKKDLLKLMKQTGRFLEGHETLQQLENTELEKTKKYIRKKSATNRKEDLPKLMVQTTRLFEEKEKLKQEKANLVEILKMQTEVQQRKILQLESQLEPGTVAVSACIEMGYSHENVMRASQIFHERQGCTAEHLMRILMKMEEEEELQGAVGGGQG